MKIYHHLGGLNVTDTTDRPSPTILATQCRMTVAFAESGERRAESGERMNKPPYQIPTMAEVRAVPWNGYTVASTFSGCGGSCTGYRMAGFRVVWANEFVPIAQESYKANADPHCHLDGRDIKLVTAADIFKATGLKEGSWTCSTARRPVRRSAPRASGKRDGARASTTSTARFSATRRFSTSTSGCCADSSRASSWPRT